MENVRAIRDATTLASSLALTAATPSAAFDPCFQQHIAIKSDPCDCLAFEFTT